MVAPSQPNTPAVRKAIRDAMARKRLQIESLAEQASRLANRPINKGTISKILNGKHKSIREDILGPVAQVLETDLAEVAQQTRLQLAITNDFMAKAFRAIDQHILSVDEDLRAWGKGAKLTGSVRLRLEGRPNQRVFERTFSISWQRPRPSRVP